MLERLTVEDVGEELFVVDFAADAAVATVDAGRDLRALRRRTRGTRQ